MLDFYLPLEFLPLFETPMKSRLLTVSSLEVGGKRYPNSGQILIMAGAVGMKGGRPSNDLLAPNGSVLAVEELLDKIVDSQYFSSLLKKENDLDVTAEKMKMPEFAAKLAAVTKERGFTQTVFDNLKYIAALENRKPNLIFDTELKSFLQFHNICAMAQQLHYEVENIHLIWALNRFEAFQESSRKWNKVCNDDVVKAFYHEISRAVEGICELGDKLKKYMDGDIWISFNETCFEGVFEDAGQGYRYTKDNMFKIKSAGELVSFPELDGEKFPEKIVRYTGDRCWKYFQHEEMETRPQEKPIEAPTAAAGKIFGRKKMKRDVFKKRYCRKCQCLMELADTYGINNPYVGYFEIHVPYKYCPVCKEKYVSSEFVSAQNDKFEEIAAELVLKNFPPDKYEYLSEGEVLDRWIDEQTEKHPFFLDSNDFSFECDRYLWMLPNSVFSIIWNGKRIFLKKSYDLYLKTGKGFFDITKPEKPEEKENGYAE